eukprot:6379667-Amphidinium_carterae.1
MGSGLALLGQLFWQDDDVPMSMKTRPCKHNRKAAMLFKLPGLETSGLQCKLTQIVMKRVSSELHNSLLAH